MNNIRKWLIVFISFIIFLSISNKTKAQQTQIRGFVEAHAFFEDDKLSFGIGEQDLFITSQLSDRFSFLGESVFKFSSSSPTHFAVSVERVIVSYNYKGNHNLLIGKHHTPINYWNDSYHHGRVFFPTVGRPLLFSAKIIPIHTTGIALQGLNLGDLKFGYNVMLGNGLGSSDVLDNDNNKSLTASIHIKPWDYWQFGTSYYGDVVSAGAEVNGMVISEDLDQQLYSATVAYFGSKFELLAEGTMASTTTSGTGTTTSYASYVYAGIRLNEKWIPYLRFDDLSYENNEPLFNGNDATSILAGLRYEINYLIVVKLEYQHIDRENTGISDIVTTQIAIGF